MLLGYGLVIVALLAVTWAQGATADDWRIAAAVFAGLVIGDLIFGTWRRKSAHGSDRVTEY